MDFRIVSGLLLLLGLYVSQNAVAEVKKPVSLSYENLILCFPELNDKSLSYKVDLNKLKEVVDNQFVTSYSQLLQRSVSYIDSTGQSFVLDLRNTYEGKKKISTSLMLRQVKDKGVLVELPIGESQRNNPSDSFVDSLLFNSSIKSDVSSYVDTKLNEVTSSYNKEFKEVQEFKLVDKIKSRSLFCEKLKDLGIICTCSKK